jgi:hypothetical protein
MEQLEQMKMDLAFDASFFNVVVVVPLSFVFRRPSYPPFFLLSPVRHGWYRPTVRLGTGIVDRMFDLIPASQAKGSGWLRCVALQAESCSEQINISTRSYVCSKLPPFQRKRRI